MKPWLVVTLAAGLAACSLRPTPAAPAQPAATALVPQPATAAIAATAPPRPTRTAPPPSAAPSLTASPVLKASPVLSATRTPVPTPDPNQGVGDTVYTDQFDGKSGWYWNYVENDVVAFSPAGGKLNAVMKVSTAGARVTGGKPDLKIGDQQVQVTATTNLCYTKDEYGVMFRVNADGTDGYLFKLSCEGKAQVDVLHNFKPTVLVDWTPSAAIMAGAPAQNTLMVWAAQDQFNFYVNDRYLFSASDKTFADGTYGFYIYDRTSGGASVSFSQMTVRAVKAGP